MTTAATIGVVRCGDNIDRLVNECRRDTQGTWWPRGTFVGTPGGNYISTLDPSCVQHGGAYYHASEMTTYEGLPVPRRSLFTCRSCAEVGLRADSVSGPDGYLRCEDCYLDEVGCCEECDGDCLRDRMYEDDDGRCVCPDCHNPGILGYGDKTANHLKPETTDALKYGIELEVEAENSLRSGTAYIRKWLSPQYCVLKRDGSLGSTGIEIVTRPDSMAVHRKSWQKFFDDSPGRALTSWSNGRCGMHVHVSKAALSQLQLGKMLCFLNEPLNQNVITKIAGRSKSRWCRVFKKKASDVLHHNGDRYVALNITSKTAEFRIFKGTLNHAGFLKNLEFVEALVQFCGPAQRSIADATSYRAFCDWLPKKDYPNLYAFLHRKGFLRRRAA